eukprot:gene6441-8862_t
MNLLHLSDEILLKIFSYQTCHEFCLLSTINKEFKSNNRHLLNRAWLMFLLRKWNIPLYELQFFLNLCKENISYPLLYHSAHPIINGLSCLDSKIRKSDSLSNINTAVFIGTVGQGNRSIQGYSAFPSMKAQQQYQYDLIEDYKRFLANVVNSIFTFINIPTISLYSEKKTIENTINTFSCPFKITKNSNSATISSYYCKPRYISYYEVEVKRLTSESQQVNNSNYFNFECIAVGLATKVFLKEKRLPGWDSESYGYHGDDGAIYHGKGRRLSSFGPTFGFDDTIGCGLNHHEKNVFFTLNGNCLGVAFTEVNVEGELYPTVGIDAAVSIHFNFGLSTFKFDLLSYINQSGNVEL